MVTKSGVRQFESSDSTSHGTSRGLIEWRRFCIGWVWAFASIAVSAGFVHGLIGIRVYRLAPWMFDKWVLENKIPPLQFMFGMFAVLLGWAFVMTLGYALLYRGIPCTGWRKGLFYGLMLWALCGISIELFDLNTTKIPTAVSLMWIILMLVVSVSAGLALGIVYPGRRVLKEGSPVFTQGPYQDISGMKNVARTVWNEVKENRLRFVFAILGIGVFIALWDGLAFFATRGFYEKAASVLRAGALEGRFSVVQIVGLAIAAGYLSAVFTLSYLILRRGIPQKGWMSGLLFGAWLGVFTVFPLGLSLLNGFKMATSSVLVTMVLIPLVQFMGMGALVGFMIPKN